MRSEGEGFEPSKELPPYGFSRAALSTAQPPFLVAEKISCENQLRDQHTKKGGKTQSNNIETPRRGVSTYHANQLGFFDLKRAGY